VFLLFLFIRGSTNVYSGSLDIYGSFLDKITIHKGALYTSHTLSSQIANDSKIDGKNITECLNNLSQDVITKNISNPPLLSELKCLFGEPNCLHKNWRRMITTDTKNWIILTDTNSFYVYEISEIKN